MGLATVLGLAPRGYFIPYRYASGLGRRAGGYPALERILDGHRATFGYYPSRPEPGGAIGWIIWSPGPDGIYDIDPFADYDPRLTELPLSLLNKTYDPTNGTRSRGDVYRLKQ